MKEEILGKIKKLETMVNLDYVCSPCIETVTLGGGFFWLPQQQYHVTFAFCFKYNFMFSK